MITYSSENINCSMHKLESNTSDYKVCGNAANEISLDINLFFKKKGCLQDKPFSFKKSPMF